MQPAGAAALGSLKEFVPSLQNRHHESSRGLVGAPLSFSNTVSQDEDCSELINAMNDEDEEVCHGVP